VIQVEGGAAMKGTLHLPRGGTSELAENARAAAKLRVAKTGPHGGKVQIVGDDRIEIVANPEGGEARVYVLGPDLKPVPLDGRRVTLAVVGSRSEIVVLTPGPKDEYATGKLTISDDPEKVTVCVARGERSHVVLVDYEPGVVVVVGRGAPHAVIFVKGTFWVAPAVVVVEDDDDDHHHHHHHHHTNVHIKDGKHGHVHVNVH
jgi:hypothetical protein